MPTWIHCRICGRGSRYITVEDPRCSFCMERSRYKLVVHEYVDVNGVKLK